MLVFNSRFIRRYSVIGSISSVKTLFLIAIFVLTPAAMGPVAAQTGAQEVSEVDGQPVLTKHLPDYENVRASAEFTTDKKAVSTWFRHPVVDAIEFWPGTEAVTAAYPQGRLLIVEYTTPQSSTEIDSKVQQQLAASPDPSVVYRRIGNYNVFVFDVHDQAAATALLDQVKYEKAIQWLGEDPYLLKKLERYMVTTSRDIMISTVMVILLGLGGSAVAGVMAGLIFFRIRDQKRMHRTKFSDAGGLTRLNLDGLSE
jgi:hypothetical protein